MVASIGSTVPPWYKGNHVWKVKGTAQLDLPVQYADNNQGDVSYDPKIMLLESSGGCSALWFNYWISTDKTDNKMRWGGGPPILEENVLLELLKGAIKDGLSSKDFLSALANEIKYQSEK